MKFIRSTYEDVYQIQSWIDADPYHKDIGTANWWIASEDCFLATRLDDDEGPVLYLRFDRQSDNFLRMACQFAPQSVVSKRRIVVAILRTFPAFIENIKSLGFAGMAFYSESPLLIHFMTNRRFGFKQYGEDFRLEFQEK